MPLLARGPLAEAAEIAAAGTLKTTEDVLRTLGIRAWQTSADLLLNLPDVAENGALVPIEVNSKLLDVRRFVVVAERNPFPLIADFRFEAGTLPWIDARIKLAESSHVAVYAETARGWLQARRFVRVIAGGCG